MELKTLVSEVSQCFYLWLPFSTVERDVADFFEQNGDGEKFQAALVAEICESQVAKCFPVHPDKSLKFVKALIRVLERSGVEVSDELYDALSSTPDQEVFYKSYFIDSVYVLSLGESVEMISHGTAGLKTWQAAEALTHFLRSCSELVTGKSVLELGSGVGFTGISLVKLGLVDSIVLSDCHGRVLDKLRHNCRVNFAAFEEEESRGCLKLIGGSKEVKVVDIDWDTFSENDLSSIEPECVIAADVVYDPSIVPSLVKTIATCLARGAAFALVACTPRNPETLNRFLTSLREQNLAVDERTSPILNPDGVLFYHITQK